MTLLLQRKKPVMANKPHRLRGAKITAQVVALAAPTAMFAQTGASSWTASARKIARQATSA